MTNWPASFASLISEFEAHLKNKVLMLMPCNPHMKQVSKLPVRGTESERWDFLMARQRKPNRKVSSSLEAPTVSCPLRSGFGLITRARRCHSAGLPF